MITIASVPMSGGSVRPGRLATGYLNHAVELDGSEFVRVLCGRVKLTSLLQDAALYDEREVECPTCARRMAKISNWRPYHYERYARALVLSIIRANIAGPTFYVTTYCNHAHRLSDGAPLDHQCYVLPPAALEAERQGDYERGITLLQAAKPLRIHQGARMARRR